MKQPNPWRVFAVVALAVFLSILDLFIVNIAFPDLRRDFGGTSVSGLSWVLTAYAIVFAAVLVPAGKLGGLYGRRRMVVGGRARFTLCSALCGAPPAPLRRRALRRGARRRPRAAGDRGGRADPELARPGAAAVPARAPCAGDRRMGRHRRGRRFAGTAAGRPAGGGELALDLPRQRAARRAG